MKVNDLDFCEFDPDDKELAPDSPDSCLRIIRALAHSLSNGQIPGDFGLRLGLLFAVVAKLAIACGKAVRAAKEEVPPSEHEGIELIASHSMCMFVSAAAMWAEVAEQDSNSVAAFGDD